MLGRQRIIHEKGHKDRAYDRRHEEGEQDQPEDLLEDLRRPAVVSDKLVDVLLNHVTRRLGGGVAVSRGAIIEKSSI